MGLFFSLMIDMRTPLAMPSLSSSDLRAEGGGAFFESNFVAKKKVRSPVYREQVKTVSSSLIKNRQEFLPAFY